MRAGVEPRGFEMTPNVRHHRGRLGGKRNGRMRHVTVDVVDSEADALEMKRRDRTVECFRFVDERLQFFSVRLIGANEREEIGEAVLCRLPAVRGHVRTIVDCGTHTQHARQAQRGWDTVMAWSEDARVSSRRISVKKGG